MSNPLDVFHVVWVRCKNKKNQQRFVSRKFEVLATNSEDVAKNLIEQYGDEWEIEKIIARENKIYEKWDGYKRVEVNYE